MLKRIIAEKWFAPKAVVGFWPAAQVGDDIRLFADDSRRTTLDTFFTLRQQLSKRDGRPNLALADFVAPLESGIPDYIGAFVVTSGLEEEAIAKRFERANDDYSAILSKALADRFAEALAEALHARVRRELWGYAPDESFTPQDLIAESYRGIRPAPGYPAQPDHTEKETIFRLLDAEARIGVKLTEILCDVARLVGQRRLYRPPRRALFRRRQGRTRSGRGLRGAQGHGGRRSRTLARAGAQLQADGGRCGGVELASPAPPELHGESRAASPSRAAADAALSSLIPAIAVDQKQ